MIVTKPYLGSLKLINYLFSSSCISIAVAVVFLVSIIITTTTTKNPFRVTLSWVITDPKTSIILADTTARKICHFVWTRHRKKQTNQREQECKQQPQEGPQYVRTTHNLGHGMGIGGLGRITIHHIGIAK